MPDETSDDTLTAANVQKVLQGVLDAWNELAAEFLGKKRAAHWDIINEGLFAAERLNSILSERLKATGVVPAPTRSPREKR
jgi:hypothetical protein